MKLPPTRHSGLAQLLRRGALRVGVAMVQVSPADSSRPTLARVVRRLRQNLMAHAPTVAAEVNERVPFTFGDTEVNGSDFDAIMTSDLAPPVVETAAPGRAERVIGGRVARLVPPGAVLQLGSGSIPNATAGALMSHPGFAVHSGFVSDSGVDRVEAGVTHGGRPRVRPSSAAS